MNRMPCPDWEERLSLYVDGLLNPFEENAVEAHLSRCEVCRHTVALWRSIGTAIRRMPSVNPPSDLRLRILDCTTYRRLRGHPWLPKGWQLAPVLGLGLLLAWMSFNPATVSRASSTSSRLESPAPATLQATAMPEPQAQLSPSVPVPEKGIVPQVVITIKASPSFRVSSNTPRWVGATRLSPVEPNLPEPVAPQTNPIGISNRTLANPIVTEVADTPYEPISLPADNAPDTPKNSPRSQHDLTRPTALAEWAQQFNAQLRQQRVRTRPETPSLQNTHFIPIVSIPLR